MDRVQPGYVQLVLHDDENTPQDFVIGLLRSVFSLSPTDAVEVMITIEKRGKAVCGTYPRAVAEALLQVAQERIRTSGHQLAMTAQAGEDISNDRCKLCGEFSEDPLRLVGKAALVCDDCVLATAEKLGAITETKRFDFACTAIEWHFAGIPRDRLVATSRQFPGHMRADVQAAVDKLFSIQRIRFFGIQERHRYETLTFASLTSAGQAAHAIAPAQYHDVEIGEAEAVKCLDNGLWLCGAEDLKYAVLLSAHREHGEETGVRIEIAAPAGAAGTEFVRRCFIAIEDAVNAANSYRGKILSFDGGANYRGRSQGLMVHKLPPVERANVILPDATLKLLDRNILNFVQHRAKLRQLGQSTRKGILLYGPPGTGKTHTIRYLASNLPGHTTLIITAAQVELLRAYTNLARLLQPAMVVIEDVDLIATDREMMGPCEESMLNMLLNEMDGIERGCGYSVCPDDQPARTARGRTGRPTRPGRSGD
jgi:ATP-dependent Clp protease adapter protein ClpS